MSNAINTVTLTSKNGRHVNTYILQVGAELGTIIEDGVSRRARPEVMADEIKSYRNLGWTAEAKRFE